MTQYLQEYKMTTALMAFLHHLFAFTLVACVVYEFIAYRKGMTIDEARRIQRADLVYGISAGLLLAVGLLRVFFFEKGVNFYTHSPFFWVKMNAFLIVGLLSIDPTIRYLRWNKTLKENRAPEINDSEFKRTRLLLSLEVIGLAVVLFAAAMMARGIGMN
jgi:putative membrane protein